VGSFSSSKLVIFFFSPPVESLIFPITSSSIHTFSLADIYKFGQVSSALLLEI
jgi:hypothetical protein